MIMEKDFDIEIGGLGMNRTEYPGAFTPTVDRIINQTIYGRVLHLFSGISKIGDIRVDTERLEATNREDVLEFIGKDKTHWDFVILDPPYEIKRKSKIEVYARVSSVAADVILRTKLSDYFLSHTDNVLWLDMCAPLPKGFKRKKLWFLFPGGYHTLRVLSWLKPEAERTLWNITRKDKIKVNA